MTSENPHTDSSDELEQTEETTPQSVSESDAPTAPPIPDIYSKMKDAESWCEFTGVDGQPLKSSTVYRMRLTPSKFSNLLASPKSGHPALLQRGQSILAGQWKFGIDRLEVPPARAPWGPPFPSVNFSDRIHRFEWLRDLLACGEDGEKLARSLTVSWVNAFGKWDETAWRIDVTADRVINWLSASPITISRLPESKKSNLLECLARQIHHISLSYSNAKSLRAKFRCSIALTLAGVCLPDGEEYLETGLNELEQVIDAQILKDGGHVSRSPSRLAETLIDLSIVEDLLLRMGKESPAFISRAQTRMQNMLKFLQTEGKGLIVANSGSDGWNSLAKAALAPFGDGGGKFAFAQQTGFQRIKAGSLSLYMDTGASETGENTEIASASCLSIHVTDGPNQIITSMGSHPDLDPEWSHAARQTAASSTLILDDLNSGEFVRNADSGLYEIIGPPGVSARRLEEGDQFLLEGQHSGWRDQYGLVHRRRLYVAKNGNRITGEDSVYRPLSETLEVTEEEISCALRFQLHPDVNVAQSDDETTAFLKISDTKNVWKLRSELPLSVEKMVYTASGMRKHAAQIAIYCKVNPMGDGTIAPNRLRWALSRISEN